jgi:hypothetical protein
MATKHVRSNTAQGLIAVQADFGLTYVTLAQANILAQFYGAKIVGKHEPISVDTQYTPPCKPTGRRVLIRK